MRYVGMLAKILENPARSHTREYAATRCQSACFWIMKSVLDGVKGDEADAIFGNRADISIEHPLYRTRASSSRNILPTTRKGFRRTGPAFPSLRSYTLVVADSNG